tara:strand:- start:436 stop:936 length:501 start_codon:yes stop_codon:yes gene_type:complete
MTPEQFYGIASSIGLSRDFTFRVTNINGVAGDGLTLVKSSVIPGRNIENIVAHVYGQEFNLGGAVRYAQADGFPVEFFVDAQGSVRGQLELLSQRAFNWGKGESYSGEGNFMSLQMLDATGGGGTMYTLHGVQIREIGPINYMLDGTGEVASFTSTFAYQYYDGGK